MQVTTQVVDCGIYPLTQLVQTEADVQVWQGLVQTTQTLGEACVNVPKA